MKLAACVLLVTLTLAVALVAWDAHSLLRGAKNATEHVDGLVADLTIDYAFKAEKADRILAALQETSHQADLLVIEQRRQLQKTSADADKTVKATRLVIDRAGLLFKHADEELAVNSSQAGEAIEGVSLAARSLKLASDTLQVRADDPQIPELLGRWNVISSNLEIVSANSAAMSGDMKLAVHRLAAPPSKFHTFLDMSYTGLKFGSLFIP